MLWLTSCRNKSAVPNHLPKFCFPFPDAFYGLFYQMDMWNPQDLPIWPARLRYCSIHANLNSSSLARVFSCLLGLLAVTCSSRLVVSSHLKGSWLVIASEDRLKTQPRRRELRHSVLKFCFKNVCILWAQVAKQTKAHRLQVFITDDEESICHWAVHTFPRSLPAHPLLH